MPIGKYVQTFENGYWPTAPKTGGARVPHSIRDARNILLEPDFSVSSAKNIGASLHGSSMRLYLVNNNIGYIDAGSITFYQSNGYFYVGVGAAGVGGTGPGGFAVDLGQASNNIMFLLNGVKYTAGLSIPGAPALTLSMTSGKITGDVAVILTRRRKATGAEGNGSVSSNVVTGSQNEVIITFPAADFLQDSWGLYATFTGFGLEGPFYLLKDVDIAPMGGTVQPGQVPFNGGQLTTSWYNSELAARQPPTDHNPPLTGLFVGAINNILLNIGVYGGVSIQPSIPNDPESYPFSTIITTNPPEVIQGVIGRPGENEFTFWTLDSIQSLVPTGSANAPVLIRGRWPISGVQHKNGLTYAQADIYCACGQGLVHIPDGGAPEKVFARAVQKFVRNLSISPADIAVGYDERYDHVVYFLGSTHLALIYNRQIDKWSPPLLIPGTVDATLTLNGVLYISIAGSLYQWESGTGGAYYLEHDWSDDPQSSSTKTITAVQATLDTKGVAAELDFQVNLIDTTKKTLVIPAVSMQGCHTTDLLLINEICKQYNCVIKSTGPGHEIVEVTYQYNYMENVRANVR